MSLVFKVFIFIIRNFVITNCISELNQTGEENYLSWRIEILSLNQYKLFKNYKNQ